MKPLQAEGGVHPFSSRSWGAQAEWASPSGVSAAQLAPLKSEEDLEGFILPKPDWKQSGPGMNPEPEGVIYPRMAQVPPPGRCLSSVMRAGHGKSCEGGMNEPVPPSPGTSRLSQHSLSRGKCPCPGHFVGQAGSAQRAGAICQPQCIFNALVLSRAAGVFADRP